ncbi:MAG: hypothetical protein NTZ32_24045 [Planctomycetales bacterium]|nr:hypothetical protein [Planctomycetales bacterium]
MRRDQYRIERQRATVVLSKNHTNPKRERGRRSSDIRPRSHLGLVW